MSTAGMTLDQANAFMALEPRLVALLKQYYPAALKVFCSSQWVYQRCSTSANS